MGQHLLAIDLLLHGAAGDEAEHHNVLALADAERAVHTLQAEGKEE